MAFGIKRDSLDALFSDYIRTRDGWKCQVCGKEFGGPPAQGLHTAHCFSRASKALRWNPSNAAAACFVCHVGPNNDDALDRNVKEKYVWFKKRLGEKRFTMLEWQYHNPGKFRKTDREAIRIFLKAEIKRMQQEREGEILGRH